MNKKIIAIAVASVMAAPVAMADVTISGRMGGHLTMVPKEGSNANNAVSTKGKREFGDAGQGRLQFDFTAGKMYARFAYNDATSSETRDDYRDRYLGLKFGGSSVQMGTMAGVASNLESDPYIATFLESRKTAAEAYTATNFGSSGFVKSVLQYATKAGGMSIKAQYGPTDNVNNVTSSGHIGFSVKGKAGPATVWAAYNNGKANGTTGTSANEVNVKVGASMKMGMVKLTVNVTDADDGGATAALKDKSTSTLVMANFGLGNGLSADVAHGSNGDKGTWTRAAIAKQMDKNAVLYAGAVSTKAAGSGTSSITTFGFGGTVKF